MTHTPAPTLLSGVGGFERAAPTAADTEKKKCHAPVGFGLASSSLRLTALLSYACIATVVTKGPCQEAGAGCQRPCTSRSVPTRALCFSTQIVIITRSSEKLLKIGPRGHVAPRGEGRNRTENTRHYEGCGSRLGREDTSLRRARVPPPGNPCRLEGEKGEGRVFEELCAIIHTFSPGLSRGSAKISLKKHKFTKIKQKKTFTIRGSN